MCNLLLLCARQKEVAVLNIFIVIYGGFEFANEQGYKTYCHAYA